MHSKILSLNKQNRAREMAQGLNQPSALSGDQSWAPITHASQLPGIPAPRNLMPSSYIIFFLSYWIAKSVSHVPYFLTVSNSLIFPICSQRNSLLFLVSNLLSGCYHHVSLSSNSEFISYFSFSCVCGMHVYVHVFVCVFYVCEWCQGFAIGGLGLQAPHPPFDSSSDPQACKARALPVEL